MKSPSPSGGIHPIGDDSGGFEIQPPAFDRIIVLSVYRIINFRNGYKLVFSESPAIALACVPQASIAGPALACVSQASIAGLEAFIFSALTKHDNKNAIGNIKTSGYSFSRKTFCTGW